MNISHSALYSNEHSPSPRATLYRRIRHRLYDPISRVFFLISVAHTKVKIQKRDYPYFVHWYNYTWTNERAVEISYFQRLVSLYPPQKTLEIGNTLGHYLPIRHTVVDKYETDDAVQNLDVLDFKPRGKFELIIAISTLEHVGWHEKEKRAEKALEAISHLHKLLAPKGRLIFSFPLGVNPALDKALKENQLSQAKFIFLRRKNTFNMWEETSYNQIKSVKYNTPFPNANAICIVTMTK